MALLTVDLPLGKVLITLKKIGVIKQFWSAFCMLLDTMAGQDFILPSLS